MTQPRSQKSSQPCDISVAFILRKWLFKKIGQHRPLKWHTQVTGFWFFQHDTPLTSINIFHHPSQATSQNTQPWHSGMAPNMAPPHPPQKLQPKCPCIGSKNPCLYCHLKKKQVRHFSLRKACLVLYQATISLPLKDVLDLGTLLSSFLEQKIPTVASGWRTELQWLSSLINHERDTTCLDEEFLHLFILGWSIKHGNTSNLTVIDCSCHMGPVLLHLLEVGQSPSPCHVQVRRK